MIWPARPPANRSCSPPRPTASAGAYLRERVCRRAPCMPRKSKNVTPATCLLPPFHTTHPSSRPHELLPWAPAFPPPPPASGARPEGACGGCVAWLGAGAGPGAGSCCPAVPTGGGRAAWASSCGGTKWRASAPAAVRPGSRSAKLRHGMCVGAAASLRRHAWASVVCAGQSMCVRVGWVNLVDPGHCVVSPTEAGQGAATFVGAAAARGRRPQPAPMAGACCCWPEPGVAVSTSLSLPPPPPAWATSQRGRARWARQTVTVAPGPAAPAQPSRALLSHASCMLCASAWAGGGARHWHSDPGVREFGAW